MASVQETSGFLVADARGRPVGRVESSMYGTAPDQPDALAVRSGVLIHHHFIVPTSAIEAIDDRRQLIGLRVERKHLQRFL